MKLFLVLGYIVGVTVAQRCGENEFLCEATNVCIPKEKVCDGYSDCFGGSDEVNCPPTTTTSCPGFVCKDGDCIPPDWRCDEFDDCLEGEDELNCPSTTTTPCSGFTCNDGHCIPDYWQCDGDRDCRDGEDEAGCPCDGFMCDNGNCVRDSYVCDGDNDCGDCSDETEEACPCAPDGIRCPKPPGSDTPGVCIPPEYVCDEDGIWDCFDGSDQKNCSKPSIFDAHKPHYRPETQEALQIKRILKANQKREHQNKYSSKHNEHTKH